MIRYRLFVDKFNLMKRYKLYESFGLPNRCSPKLCPKGTISFFRIIINIYGLLEIVSSNPYELMLNDAKNFAVPVSFTKYWSDGVIEPVEGYEEEDNFSLLRCKCVIS